MKIRTPTFLATMDDERKQRVAVYLLVLGLIGMVGVGSLAAKAQRDVNQLKPRITVIEKTIKVPAPKRIVKVYRITKVVYITRHVDGTRTITTTRSTRGGGGTAGTGADKPGKQDAKVSKAGRAGRNGPQGARLTS